MTGNNTAVYMNGEFYKYYRFYQIHGYCFLGFNGNDPVDYLDFDSAEITEKEIRLNYYNHNGIEAWDVIDRAMEYFGDDLTGSEAFYVGNILKYLLRFKSKGQRNQDLEKIQVYCDRLKQS